MHARMARYAVDPERMDDAVEGFRNASEGLSGLDGFVNGYLLVDPDSGMLSSLTFWQSRRALEESATRAGAMRLRAIQQVDGSCVSVAELEVPLTFGDSPTVAAPG